MKITQAPHVRRNSAGHYTVSDGAAEVNVIRNDALAGPAKWIAYATWDRYLSTDPLLTMRAAVAQARAMLTKRER